MSIFKKDCPECAASNSVNALRCECGYCFDPDALAGNDAAAYAEEQDRLYRDYLEARIVQAEVELTVAREQAKADAANTYKAAAALVAEQALNALQAEMKQLGLRAPHNRPRNVAVPPAKPASVPAPARPAPPPHKAAVAAPVEKRPGAAAAAEARMPAARHLATAIEQRAPAVAIAKPAPSKTRAITVAAVRAVSKIKAKVVAVAVGQTKRQMPIPAASAKPGAHFRELQARKAEAIAKAQTPAARTETKRPEALAQRPARMSDAAQACPSCTATVPADQERCRCGYVFSKAAQGMPGVSLSGAALAAPPGTLECPNCTATVAATRQRCNCGYTFSQATEQVPALTLDAAALAILTDGISANRTSRRR